MSNAYERFVRPLLFSFDPETAHDLTVACLRAASHVDLALSGLRRRHELPYGIKHDLKLSVILLFEHFDFFCEIFLTR